MKKEGQGSTARVWGGALRPTGRESTIVKSDRLMITYVGGSTASLEMGEFRLLTDPTFDPAGEEYVTPVCALRKTEGPTLKPEMLGRVDAVLLSHDNHKVGLTSRKGAKRSSRHFRRRVWNIDSSGRSPDGQLHWTDHLS